MNNAEILVGDCLEVLPKLPERSVQCCVTSPPYYGLRDYGVHGQLGLEATPEQYVAKLVAVFREVRRVLRDDGTLWLNLGDSYARQAGDDSTKDVDSGLGRTGRTGKADILFKKGCNKPPAGLKPKDLIGIPWRVAFALQADGWYLRSEIIWHKPNPMPESVRDRPTKSHEQIFLLTKSARYYYDAEAVAEPQTESTRERAAYGWNGRTDDHSNGARTGSTFKRMAASGEPIATIPQDGKRNRRTVWTISTEPYAQAHFATYPTKLVEPCILAGTSERGCCPSCGAPWERVVEKEQKTSDGRAHPSPPNGTAHIATGHTRLVGALVYKTTTTGWHPTCHCGEDVDSGGMREDGTWIEVRKPFDPVPCVVLDPFAGSGTTGAVAVRHNRRFIGIELNPDYLPLIEKRLHGVQSVLL